MTVLGTGIFMWSKFERQSNRYGYFHLDNESYVPFWLDLKPEIVTSHVDDKVVQEFLGKKVRISCVVKGTRESHHLGDSSIGVFFTFPEVGESVDLGVGKFVKKEENELKEFGLQPARSVTPLYLDEFWIDPRKLYRLHNQTVEVYIEETNDPEERQFSPC